MIKAVDIINEISLLSPSQSVSVSNRTPTREFQVLTDHENNEVEITSDQDDEFLQGRGEFVDNMDLERFSDPDMITTNKIVRSIEYNRDINPLGVHELPKEV